MGCTKQTRSAHEFTVLFWIHLKIIRVAIPSVQLDYQKLQNGIFLLDWIHRSTRARTVYMTAGEKKQM